MASLRSAGYSSLLYLLMTGCSPKPVEVPIPITVVDIPASPSAESNSRFYHIYNFPAESMVSRWRSKAMGTQSQNILLYQQQDTSIKLSAISERWWNPNQEVIIAYDTGDELSQYYDSPPYGTLDEVRLCTYAHAMSGCSDTIPATEDQKTMYGSLLQKIWAKDTHSLEADFDTLHESVRESIEEHLANILSP